MLARSFLSFQFHAISKPKIYSFSSYEFFLVRISKRSMVFSSGLRFRTMLFDYNIVGQGRQNATIPHYRHLSDDLDFIPKELTIEKQMANALACRNFEVLVNLINTSLSSSNSF